MIRFYAPYSHPIGPKAPFRRRVRLCAFGQWVLRQVIANDTPIAEAAESFGDIGGSLAGLASAGKFTQCCLHTGQDVIQVGKHLQFQRLGPQFQVTLFPGYVGFGPRTALVPAILFPRFLPALLKVTGHR